MSTLNNSLFVKTFLNVNPSLLSLDFANCSDYMNFSSADATLLPALSNLSCKFNATVANQTQVVNDTSIHYTSALIINNFNTSLADAFKSGKWNFTLLPDNITSDCGYNPLYVVTYNASECGDLNCLPSNIVVPG